MSNVLTSILVKRGTATALNNYAANIADGELVFDKTNNKIKIGDGTKRFSALPVLNKSYTLERSDDNIILKADGAQVNSISIKTVSEANHLTTNAGSTKNPVYFNGGIPVTANLLEGITGNYATKTVGNITGTTANPVQITAENIPDLLKEILGISSSVAPSGFTISASSVNVALTSSTATVTPKWSISRGTFSGAFTITATGATSSSITTNTIDVSGTFASNKTITINVANNVDKVTISGTASGASITTLSDTYDVVINRQISWGAGSASSSGWIKKGDLSSGVTKSFTLNNQKIIFKYPKYWGTLSSIDIPGVGNAVNAFNVTTSADDLYYIYEDKNVSTTTLSCIFKL